MKKTTTVPRLNAEWHKSHPMPKNPTLEQRLAWHEEHAAVCKCREMPEKLKALLKSRKQGYYNNRHFKS